MLPCWYTDGLIYHSTLEMHIKVLMNLVSRSHAVACVNQFIISRTQALMLHIDSFIEVRFTTAHVGLPWGCRYIIYLVIYNTKIAIIAGVIKIGFNLMSFS